MRPQYEGPSHVNSPLPPPPLYTAVVCCCVHRFQPAGLVERIQAIAQNVSNMATRVEQILQNSMLQGRGTVPIIIIIIIIQSFYFTLCTWDMIFRSITLEKRRACRDCVTPKLCNTDEEHLIWQIWESCRLHSELDQHLELNTLLSSHMADTLHYSQPQHYAVSNKQL